ncbi:MAG TPA: hypothetical protein VFJ85_15330 [Acidimicrobiales bacterium]|nr:hypothetical protein [Acidimicrobiales bacterium]
MSKHSREQRRAHDRARRSAGPSAEVADRAEKALAGLVEGIAEIAATRGVVVRRIDLDGFARLRRGYLERGERWAPWCYLPVAFVGAGLGEELAIDANPALVSPAALLASVVAAWLPGRIAVRFDDDLAGALMQTRLDSVIPTEVLHRLPAWGLYVDCPQLGRLRGFFAALDAGVIEGASGMALDDIDELFIVGVRDQDDGGPRHFITTLRLEPGTSIADSVAAQRRQDEETGPGALHTDEDQWVAALGMTRGEAIARMVSLLLYLCSTDADTATRTVPPASGAGRPSRPVSVVSAGFRVGAALRSQAQPASASSDQVTGRRTAPHLRRAHWHHYWCGSAARGDQRLELRWVPPVPVNADHSEALLTVVRPAGRTDA